MSKEPKYKVWKSKRKRKKQPSGITAQEMGRLGAAATNRRHTLKEKQEWGKRGGNATKAKYGIRFFKQIAEKRQADRRKKLGPPSKPRQSKDGLFRRDKAKLNGTP